MPLRLLRKYLQRRRLKDPEKLIDAVIEDMRRRLTEARLQMLAADLAHTKLAAGETLRDVERTSDSTRRGIEKLESKLKELETRRNLLVARARDANARLVIERSLMETDAEPADVALELLADEVETAEAEADAVAEVRQVSEEVRGQSGG